MKSIQKLFLLIFLSCVFINLNAAEPAVKVLVTADHADWLYQVNEKVVFKISVLQDGKPMKGGKVYYEIGPEKMPPNP